MESTPANNTKSWSGRESLTTAGSRAHHHRHSPAGDHYEAREQQVAKEWVREHQEVALITAFALGVFMGAWMRS